MQPGDAQAWLPYDTPGAVRRFLCQHRPALGVLMETEVWPNLLHEARAAGVPMVLANARLSERSAVKGRRLAALMHPAMACFTQVLAQTEADAARLRARVPALFRQRVTPLRVTLREQSCDMSCRVNMHDPADRLPVRHTALVAHSPNSKKPSRQHEVTCSQTRTCLVTWSLW
jgi:hypothetical protein